MGADIVVYSATKYLGGHSDLIGGAVVSDKENIAQIHRCFTLYGAIMGPMEAWLLCRSLRTLDLRMEQHSKNALKVARFLEGHPRLRRFTIPVWNPLPRMGWPPSCLWTAAAAVCSVPILPAASRGPAP